MGYCAFHKCLEEGAVLLIVDGVEEKPVCIAHATALLEAALMLGAAITLRISTTKKEEE